MFAPRTQFLLAAICSGAVALALAVGTGGSRASAAAGPVPARGLLFGAAVYSSDGTTVTTREDSVGRTFGLGRIYSMWDNVQPAYQIGNAVSAGRIPLVSIRPQLTDGTKIGWAQIASGAQDSAIRAQARGLQSVGHPIFLIFHHEADLSSGWGTSAEFRAAFRHYVALVRATGATNISFVVVLSAYAYRASGIANWYPGDDVVDWAGADAYNFGACDPGRPPWRTFEKAVANFRAWGQTHDKPQLLAEWGSAEDPAVPGRKADWIRDAGKTMEYWPQLRAASYFDESGSCDWRLTTSASALAAFVDLAQDPHSNGSTTAHLRGTVRADGHTVDWDTSGSTGTLHRTGTGITRWTFAPGGGADVRTGTDLPGALTASYLLRGTYSATLTVRDADGHTGITHASVTIG